MAQEMTHVVLKGINMAAVEQDSNFSSRVRPTMKDVAKRAQVSVKTVSRVVNREPRVDKETQARVELAITELGFRVNTQASNLRRRQETLTIGMVIEDIGNPFFSLIARGVEEVAQEHQCMLIIASNEKDSVRERELVSTLLHRRVEGLLVVPTSHDQEYVTAELQGHTPVVFVDRPPEHLNADAILLDNRGGTREGIEYLLALGHRRIGFIGGEPTIYTGAERLAGYREAHEKWGLSVDESLFRFACHTSAQAEAATRDLLAMKNPPTAIFADNNRMSVGVVRVLQTQAPNVSLLGFDDIELGDIIPLPIVVITHNPQEIGRQAAKMLFARIHGDMSEPQRIVIPTQLQTRGSRTTCV